MPTELDDVITMVGGAGRFQKLLLYGFVTPLYILAPLSIYNLLFMTSLPDHWCHVPGRENTNFTLLQWKEITLPREIGPDRALRFSRCQMYNVSFNETTGDWYPGHRNASGLSDVIACVHGWEYDSRDYSRTVATAHDWVCDKGTRSASVLSFLAFGYVISNVVFGQLADRIGRRLVFFITVAVLVIFRSISLFVDAYYELFLLLNLLAASAFPAVSFVLVTLVTEISNGEFRARIITTCFQCFVIGMCLLSLVAWLCRDWLLLGVVTTLPAVVPFFYWRVLPESPRWLASQGRLEEAATIFRRIMKVNGRDAPYDLMQVLENVERDKKKQFGVISLLMYPKMVVKTMLITVSLLVNSVVYYGTTVNISNMGGNEFLNFFLLAIVEVPGNFLGLILIDRFGRRWTHVAFFFINFICFAINAATITTLGSSWLEITLCVLGKFSLAVTYLVVYTQALEVFPTCARTTGMAASSLISKGVAASAPYITHLGTINLSIPYGIMGGLCLLGAIAASFIPETLNQPLLETLEEASSFWMKEKFWSWKIPPRKTDTEEGNRKEIMEVCEIEQSDGTVTA